MVSPSCSTSIPTEIIDHMKLTGGFTHFSISLSTNKWLVGRLTYVFIRVDTTREKIVSGTKRSPYLCSFPLLVLLQEIGGTLQWTAPATHLDRVVSYNVYLSDLLVKCWQTGGEVLVSGEWLVDGGWLVIGCMVDLRVGGLAAGW